MVTPLAPDLQPAGPEDPTGAFRGVMGACEAERSLYHAFVPPGARYHCGIAAAEVAFQRAAHPDEELCDWGFGELIPRPQRINNTTYWVPGAEWAGAPGTAPGTAAPEAMLGRLLRAYNETLVLGGQTAGRFFRQFLCTRGDASSCPWAHQNLSYPTFPPALVFREAVWHSPPRAGR